MRKFTLLLVLMLVIGLQAALAQKRTISGTVSSAEDNKGIPGATVLVKGTTVGVITDIDGKFSLDVPANAESLIISFVGMKSQEIKLGAGNVINITLELEAKSIEGVVVTALGISREKKALGYSVQDVKGDELVKARGASNFINTLSGKVAGVQVTGSSGTMGGSSRITIRGVNTISGSNQPLFVVDGVPLDNSNFNVYNTERGGGGFDYGNMAQDMNPDDIESISVLKGPTAAALYGSRAGNGVILITTKKGQMGKSKAIGVSWTTGVTFENVAMLPKYQNKYGGGTIYTGADGKNGFAPGPVVNGDTLYVPDFATDESWGPKYDPNINVLAWNSFDEWDTENYLKPKPWVKPENDVKDFFETGVTWNNTIALTGATAKSSFRLAFSNLSYDGYMPNSSEKRNTINMSGTHDFSDKLKAFTSFNYIKSSFLGRVETGYGDNNPMVRFNQWGQRQLDMKELEAYRNPDGSQRTWNRTSWDDPTPVYSNNPYWSRYQDYQDDSRNRFFGNFGVSYEFCDWLKVQGKLMADYYSFRVRERIAKGSTFTSFYKETMHENSEINAELLAFINHRFSDNVNLNATVGVNQATKNYWRNGGETQGGLVLDKLYTLSNSVTPALVDDYNKRKRINSFLASASIGFYNMFYLDVTGRNDWSSNLPTDKNSYFYPSITGSFIFSELEAVKSWKPLSFGKFRIGYAVVGNDGGFDNPYRITNYYIAESNFGDSDPVYRLPTTLNNPELKNEQTASTEFGLELKFLENRLGLDFAYYSNSTTDQILPVPTSATTGYTFQMINAGEITNKGYEIALVATPVKLKNSFQWDLIINYSHNQNEVVKLADGVTTYRLASLFGIEIHATEGEPFGTIRGNTFVTDANGNKVVGLNGRYVNGPIETVGSVLPDYNMGITNAFKYKNWDFSFLLDFQKGGSLFSLTHMWGIYSGILEETAGTNDKGNEIRDDVADGGGVLNNGVYGKLVNGQVVYLSPFTGADTTVAIANSTYIGAQTWAADHYSRARADQNTFDADYIKLREVRVGYTLPAKKLGPIVSANIGVYARNLFTWNLDNPHIDPESVTSSGNIQGIEGGQLPPLRSYGINLTLNF